MKLFFPVFLILFACTQSEKTDSVKDDVNEKTNITFEDTAMAGCTICVLDKKIKKLTLKKNYLINSEDSICKKTITKKLENDIDSLGKEIKLLKTKYKLNDYTAESTCSRLFPIHHLKDSILRDSLLCALYVWDRAIYPIMDTTCRENTIVDGKYSIKIKGKQFLLTQIEFDRYIERGMGKMKRIAELIDSNEKKLVRELTGIPEPDEFCIEIMVRYANYIGDKKSWKELSKVQAGMSNPDFKDMVDSLSKIK
jgi:hypothetical protein